MDAGRDGPAEGEGRWLKVAAAAAEAEDILAVLRQ